MVFLLFAICCSSLFSIILKISQKKKADTALVIFYNYLTGFIFTIIPVLVRCDFAFPRFSLEAWGFAVLEGLLFTAGFSFMDRSTWRSGVALTTASARASLILPVILSWILLHQQRPSWSLVALVLLAMSLIILPAKGEKHEDASLKTRTQSARNAKAMIMLAVVFLVFGSSDFTMKLVQQTATEGSTGADAAIRLDALMGIVFLFASIFSFVICAARGSLRKEERKEFSGGAKSLVCGLTLGLANIGATACSLRALSKISTSLYYPLYNVGIVIMATVVGILFFKEKLKWMQVVGIILAVIAISLSFQ